MKNLLNNSTISAFIPPNQYTPGETEGGAIDLKGIGRKILVMGGTENLGAGGTVDVVIQESDDNFNADITVLHTFDTITELDPIKKDLSPNKRYVRAVMTVNVDTVVFAVLAVIYLEREIPSGIECGSEPGPIPPMSCFGCHSCNELLDEPSCNLCPMCQWNPEVEGSCEPNPMGPTCEELDEEGCGHCGGIWDELPE